MSAHTPGPWTAADGPFGIVISGQWGIHPGPSIRLADMPNDERDPETWANARLIAAAPDMLAQLKRLIYFHRTNDTPNTDPWADAADVIAKAEGEAVATR